MAVVTATSGVFVTLLYLSSANVNMANTSQDIPNVPTVLVIIIIIMILSFYVLYICLLASCTVSMWLQPQAALPATEVLATDTSRISCCTRNSAVASSLGLILLAPSAAQTELCTEGEDLTYAVRSREREDTMDEEAMSFSQYPRPADIPQVPSAHPPPV